DEPMLDFTKAVVYVPEKLTGPAEKAVVMLIEEVERRTQIRWQRKDDDFPLGDGPAIVVGREDRVKKGKRPQDPAKAIEKPEGYQILTLTFGKQPMAVVAGNDDH